mmetsp:Transcript_57681/g.154120  ORF Transcript_57681/g.154120 Transcript_57681/m.154120 type:complete len:243 (+) Transcript_57681:867-1595(+)
MATAIPTQFPGPVGSSKMITAMTIVQMVFTCPRTASVSAAVSITNATSTRIKANAKKAAIAIRIKSGTNNPSAATVFSSLTSPLMNMSGSVDRKEAGAMSTTVVRMRSLGGRSCNDCFRILCVNDHRKAAQASENKTNKTPHSTWFRGSPPDEVDTARQMPTAIIVTPATVGRVQGSSPMTVAVMLRKTIEADFSSVYKETGTNLKDKLEAATSSPVKTPMQSPATQDLRDQKWGFWISPLP